MLLIRPNKITPGMVTASNAGQADPAYSGAATYNLNERVFFPDNGKTYECIEGSVTGVSPVSKDGPLHWLLAGPSNRWAMFDDETSTSTETAGDLTTTVVFPGRINAVAFFGLVGQAIEVTQRSSAGVVLSQFSRSLKTQPADWYEYFFSEPEQIPDVVFTGVVPSSGSRLEIKITGPAACASIVVGNTFDLGEAQYGASTSITDYSRKNTTADGVQSFTRGRFSRRMSMRLEQPRERYPSVQRVLESVRATPCVWLGIPGSEAYSPMTIYGYYRDFSIEVSYSTTHLCSLEIESLT